MNAHCQSSAKLVLFHREGSELEYIELLVIEVSGLKQYTEMLIATFCKPHHLANAISPSKKNKHLLSIFEENAYFWHSAFYMTYTFYEANQMWHGALQYIVKTDWLQRQRFFFKGIYALPGAQCWSKFKLVVSYLYDYLS